MDPLYLVLFQYAALQPLHVLDLPPALDLARAQPWLVDHLLQHPRLAARPPAPSYRRGFLKLLIARLEQGCLEADDSEELEVHEEILVAYVDSMQASSSQLDPGPTFKTFFLPVPGDTTPSTWRGALTLREEQKTIQAGTTGLRTWGASLRLAEQILAEPDLLRPRVLELGSGSGFLGLFAASLQSCRGSDTSSIVLTDFDELVLDKLEENVGLNGSVEMKNVKIKRLDWMDAVEAPDAIHQLLSELDPDVLLAADVIYDPSLVPPLVSTLRLALSSRPSRRAIIASTIRNIDTFNLFLSSARAAGLSVELSAPTGPRVFFGCIEGGKGAVESEVQLARLRYEPPSP